MSPNLIRFAAKVRGTGQVWLVDKTGAIHALSVSAYASMPAELADQCQPYATAEEAVKAADRIWKRLEARS